MGKVIFLTHAEVEIDPAVAVPDWGLNAVGRARHAPFAADPVLQDVGAVFSSDERKAVEAADLVSQARDLPVQRDAGLGENDRSATGYLPPDEFWPVVKDFFANPTRSIRGWETAQAAQTRIVAAVRRVIAATASHADLLIVSHGGVGTLLRCCLAARPITQAEGQPHRGGGCWFSFGRAMTAPATQWSAI